jgi:hypothetical protein
LYLCGLLSPARSKPECLIVATGAELGLEMITIRKVHFDGCGEVAQGCRYLTRGHQDAAEAEATFHGDWMLAEGSGNIPAEARARCRNIRGGWCVVDCAGCG